MQLLNFLLISSLLLIPLAYAQHVRDKRVNGKPRYIDGKYAPKEKTITFINQAWKNSL